jgi:outer membrane protein assembly factor BamE (lipoprotein component of BamABCDE complex)
MRRSVSCAIVCFIALACSACSSNNEGKIQGKWKSTGTVEGAPPGTVTAEFKTDGTFVMAALGMPVLTANYKLGSGDYVNFSNVKSDKSEKNARVKITIAGDNMTWVEEKATYQFAKDK